MARGRGAYIQTRMEHKSEANTSPLAVGASVVYSFQLESGDEECQVKRLVLSAAMPGVIAKISWGLFQEQPTAVADFTDETLFATACAASQFLIDRTTTMRVPRGWWIGVLVQNMDTNTAVPRGIFDCTFLHYKVLS